MCGWTDSEIVGGDSTRSEKLASSRNPRNGLRFSTHWDRSRRSRRTPDPERSCVRADFDAPRMAVRRWHVLRGQLLRHLLWVATIRWREFKRDRRGPIDQGSDPPTIRVGTWTTGGQAGQQHQRYPQRDPLRHPLRDRGARGSLPGRRPGHRRWPRLGLPHPIGPPEGAAVVQVAPDSPRPCPPPPVSTVRRSFRRAGSGRASQNRHWGPIGSRASSPVGVAWRLVMSPLTAPTLTMRKL